MVKIATLMSAMVLAVAVFAEDTYDSCFKKGHDSLRAGKYALAIEYLDKAIKLAPSNESKSYCMNYKAVALGGLGKMSAAADERAKILEFNDVETDKVISWVSRAIVEYAAANEYQKAHEIAEKLIALDIKKPEQIVCLTSYRVYACKRQGKYDMALKAIDDAIKKIDPQSAFRHQLDKEKMEIILKQKTYQALIDAFPDNYIKSVSPKVQYIYYYNRGLAFYGLNKYENALKEFETAAKLNQDYAHTYSRQVQAYLALNKPAEALDSYSKLEKYGKTPQWRFLARSGSASVFEQQGEYQKAADAFKSIYDDPKMTDGYKAEALFKSYGVLKKLDKKDIIKANLEAFMKMKGVSERRRKIAEGILRTL